MWFHTAPPQKRLSVRHLKQANIGDLFLRFPCKTLTNPLKNESNQTLFSTEGKTCSTRRQPDLPKLQTRSTPFRSAERPSSRSSCDTTPRCLCGCWAPRGGTPAGSRRPEGKLEVSRCTCGHEESTAPILWPRKQKDMGTAVPEVLAKMKTAGSPSGVHSPLGPSQAATGAPPRSKSSSKADRGKGSPVLSASPPFLSPSRVRRACALVVFFPGGFEFEFEFGRVMWSRWDPSTSDQESNPDMIPRENRWKMTTVIAGSRAFQNLPF